MALSFALGLALGSGAADDHVALHTHRASRPHGRGGRRADVAHQSRSFAVPLAFGAVGAAVGLAPVFWSSARALAGGGWFARADS